jgi:DNA-binding response OmpR family regulator
MNTRTERGYVLVVHSPAEPIAGCLEAVTERSDFAVDEAPTAESAIELATQRRPSLILLNLHGAESSGVEACRALIAAEPTRDVPILAIAGEPAEQQFMIALSVIPCDADALDREIQRIIAPVH